MESDPIKMDLKFNGLNKFENVPIEGLGVFSYRIPIEGLNRKQN